MKPCKCAAVELPYVVGMFGVERGARRALGVPALWVNGKEIADGDGAGTRRAQADARYRDQAQKLAALAQQQHDLQQLLARLRDIFADIPKQLPGNVPFAQLKGRLPWPIEGRARAWQGGLLIDTGAHDKVRAVANGRVAYADWLRGFGMLVVVDHGDGWITLYGNNESLLVRVGDWVTPGQVIANAGTAAAGFDGAYFALRHDGQPMDPRAWLQHLRR